MKVVIWKTRPLGNNNIAANNVEVKTVEKLRKPKKKTLMKVIECQKV